MDSQIRILDFGDSRLSLAEEDIGTCFWGLSLQVASPQQLNKLITVFFQYYQRPVNQKICLRYALQRYLAIHLHYLVANQADADKMRAQLEKFAQEEQMMDWLGREISRK